MWVYCRYFLYGVLTFCVFGFLVELPLIERRGFSYERVFYLSVGGGVSFVISRMALCVIVMYLKDLVYGDS